MLTLLEVNAACMVCVLKPEELCEELCGSFSGQSVESMLGINRATIWNVGAFSNHTKVNLLIKA